MAIFAIAEGLPRGFRDSEVDMIYIDCLHRAMRLALDVWIGGAGDACSRQETCRWGSSSIAGLQYCAVDVPDRRHPHSEPGVLTIDLAEPAGFMPPADSFARRLWIREWSSYIHLAAQTADLEWIGPPVNRERTQDAVAATPPQEE